MKREMNLRERCEKLANDLHKHEYACDGTLVMDEQEFKLLEAFAKEVRTGVIDEVAQFVEDEQYNLPGREAEWSRFIANRIRSLKSGAGT